MCFIVDAFSRMIVGWRVAGHMRTTMVLDTLEMAHWSRSTRLQGLRCHSDAGSQFTSVRYGERLAELGAVPSIGSVGDSFDNALAESVNGYDKAELIRGPTRQQPWKTVEDVELATLGCVHWHNTRRLHGYLDDLPPLSSSRSSTLRLGTTHIIAPPTRAFGRCVQRVRKMEPSGRLPCHLLDRSRFRVEACSVPPSGGVGPPSAPTACRPSTRWAAVPA